MQADPVMRLQQVFGEIAHTRMAGLPIVNPALQVEAVGFRPWQGCWAGVLVTPWSIGLVLLPGEGPALPILAADQRQAWSFPSGRYDFLGLDEPALGPCQICPLLSPVSEFASHAEALALAQEIAQALFSEGAAGQASADDARARMEQARLQGQPLLEQPISRRAFLRASFWGDRD